MDPVQKREGFGVRQPSTMAHSSEEEGAPLVASGEDSRALGPKVAGAAPVQLAEMEALTGARAVMACYVVCYHFFEDFRNGRLPGPWWCQRFTSHGLVAVTFFFQLSGFVNCAVNEARGVDYSSRQWRIKFWRKRACRLLPAYYVAFLLCVPTLWLSWRSISVAPYHRDSTKVAAVAVSALGLQSWSPGPPLWRLVNYPAWAVSCELGFYLALPWLVPSLKSLCGRVHAALLVGLATVLQLALWLSFVAFWPENHLAAQIAYVHPLIRGFEFAQGVVLGLAWPPTKAAATSKSDERPIGGALADGSFCLLLSLCLALPADLAPPYVVCVAQWPTALFLVNAATDSSSSLVVRVLRSLQPVGHWSYCAYILQAPLLFAAFFLTYPTASKTVFDLLLDRALGKEDSDADVLPLWTLPVLLILLHVLAKFTYHFVELPALAWLTSQSLPQRS